MMALFAGGRKSRGGQRKVPASLGVTGLRELTSVGGADAAAAHFGEESQDTLVLKGQLMLFPFLSLKSYSALFGKRGAGHSRTTTSGDDIGVQRDRAIARQRPAFQMHAGSYCD